MRRTILAILTILALWAPTAGAQSVDAVLDSVQYRAFRYFWYEANPANGLIRDRSQGGSPASIAAVGFGLTAICIGVDHGWVTRADAAARVQTTLNTFWNGVQRPAPDSAGLGVAMGYKGFFYHFLDMNTGMRTWTSELSDIDTALLLAGVIDVGLYFDGPGATETSIRTLSSQIYERVDWTFFRNPSLKGLMIQWTPESGFNTAVWTGYNEMMIMYLLALGSPTHPIPGGPTGDWLTYVSTYPWLTVYGQTYTPYASLFTHQYSHCWVDFRNKRDGFMQLKSSNYFENSRRASLAQQAYCIAHPGIPPHGSRPQASQYSATLWGLTAGDGPAPYGYAAHGCPAEAPGFFDDGTIQPTAAVSSVPFAPEICLPTIMNFYNNYPLLWGPYGFRDGFNLATNPDWYDTDYLGIDLGPEIIMIENYRNASVWLRFTQHPAVQAGLAAAGFVNTVDVADLPLPEPKGVSLAAGPNPFRGTATLRYRLPQGGAVKLTVHDVAGREVAQVLDEWQAAGEHAARFDAGGLASGVYWYRLATPGGVVERRGVLMR